MVSEPVAQGFLGASANAAAAFKYASWALRPAHLTFEASSLAHLRGFPTKGPSHDHRHALGFVLHRGRVAPVPDPGYRSTPITRSRR
jgi:hypothetical protein